jgi:hypothetical protein
MRMLNVASEPAYLIAAMLTTHLPCCPAAIFVLCSWAARSARVKATSPFGSRPGWGLAGVIVKSGDDCRQELMALQLIRELGEIWAGEPGVCCCHIAHVAWCSLICDTQSGMLLYERGWACMRMSLRSSCPSSTTQLLRPAVGLCASIMATGNLFSTA